MIEVSCSEGQVNIHTRLIYIFFNSSLLLSYGTFLMAYS